MAKKKRKRVPKVIVTRLRLASRESCCVCRKLIECQVHHIDGDPANGDYENLAYVCLNCHSRASQTGGFGRRLGPTAVRAHRDEWHEIVERSQDVGRMIRDLAAAEGMRDAVAAVEVWRLGETVKDAGWAESALGDAVREMVRYSGAFSWNTRRAIAEFLNDLATRVRYGLSPELASDVAHLSLGCAPLLPYRNRGTPVEQHEEFLFASSVNLGNALAYDGSLYLHDIEVARHGALLLRFMLSLARRARLNELVAVAEESFVTALDGATRGEEPLTVELLRFERSEGRGEEPSLDDSSPELRAFLFPKSAVDNASSNEEIAS